MKNMRVIFLGCLIFIGLTIIGAGQAIDSSFTYQGKLTDGGNVANGVYDFSVQLYNTEAAGAQIGTSCNIEDVQVANGLFTIILNTGGEFGSDAFNGEARWIKIGIRPGSSVGAYTFLNPLQRLTSAPYSIYSQKPAYSAGDGLTLSTSQFSVNYAGNGSATTAARSDHNHFEQTWDGASGGNGLAVRNSNTGAGNGILGTTAAPAGGANAYSGIHGICTDANADDIGYGVAGETYSGNGAGVAGFAGGSAAAVLGWNGSSSNGADAIRGESVGGSGYTNAIHGICNSIYGHAGRFEKGTNGTGIGIAVYAQTGGDPVPGGFEHTNSNYAVVGNAGGGIGVVGYTDNVCGVYGKAYGSSYNSGVTGETGSIAGCGVIGRNTGATLSIESAGVKGEAGWSSSTGGYGVWGKHGGTGPGVYGESGSGYGVCGQTNGEYSAGVVGYGPEVSGNRNYAYLGTKSCSIVTSGQAIFNGNATIYGTLNATVKNFMIDHPQDPENKYLCHSSVESSEMMNLYTGNIILNEAGEGVVELPGWFESLNKDFRYQLTPVGASASGLYIAEKVKDGKFKIAGGSSGLEVSWQVTGVRKDPYAVANPLEVEKPKDDKDKGKYISPKVYGKSAEEGIGYISPLEQKENKNANGAK